MAKETPKNKTVSFKVDIHQLEYINELKANGINLRDVVDYYRINNENETKRLKNRHNYLVRHIEKLKKELSQSEEELKEVRIKLNLAPSENQDRLDLIDAEELILQRVKSKYGNNLTKSVLLGYINSSECDRVLNPIIINYNIQDREEFKNELKKRFEL